MKNKFIILLIIFFALVINFNFAKAQNKKVDYKGSEVILDSDLDGLTDEGEKQIFETDEKNPDTDGDGILDGAEIINGTDPLNVLSPSLGEAYYNNFPQVEIPWAWYFTRASALVGFLILYLSIFFGLSIRTPILKKIIQPIYSFKIHCWISLQALFFALLHGVSLLFDKFLSFNLANIFLPFSHLSQNAVNAGIDSKYLAMGILAFYLMLILLITSYLKRFIPHLLWRLIHFLNIILWIFAVYHSLALGTDMKNEIFRSIFIYANFLLVAIFVVNILAKTWNLLRSKF